jgi:SAM-dependent methyltransferase
MHIPTRTTSMILSAVDSHAPLHFHRRKWLLIQRLLKRAGLDPASSRWLDVGCGQGQLLGLAGKHFFRASGCDPSPGMLGSCASFSVCEQPSPATLPYEDSSMDFVNFRVRLPSCPWQR